MKSLALAIALLLAAAPADAAFNPVEFFRGRTHGEGTLKIILQASKHITVDSVGRTEKDGALLLEQVVHEPGKPARIRHWRLRQVAPDRFEGTLTDASGPVRVTVEDNDAIRIRYTAKDHLEFDQLLTAVSATEVRNRTRVKRFGIVVAHFTESIRKLD